VNELATAVARARKALEHVDKKGREAQQQGRNAQGAASLVSLSYSDLEALLQAIEVAGETIVEGKRQWDEVAAALGADGDCVDAVLAAAKAKAHLVPPIRAMSVDELTTLEAVIAEGARSTGQVTNISKYEVAQAIIVAINKHQQGMPA
jgi:hypothetical protein